jgi:DNA polymerase I
MKVTALYQQGYQLLHEGSIALAEVEANGIRIDMPRLVRTRQGMEDKMRALRTELEEDPVWRIWKRRFGDKSKLTSRDQLAFVLYEALKYPVTDFTDSGKPSTEDEVLQKIDHPFVAKWSKLLDYDKTAGTFLKGIENEVVDGRLHPVFSLHTVRTFRSSSEDPNFHNFPVRDKTMAELIRRCFIASEGCVLVENDFKGVEVSVSACYHEDANFISYITTPGKDMHRDMAAQIYCLEPGQVSKDARYGAKNKFVFPQFYGDYYVACAKNMWEWIDKGKLTGPGGTSLKGWLKATKGIMELGDCNPEESPRPGTFEQHVKEVEDDFWNNRFQDYGKWRKRWYEQYLERGYFDMFTGFRVYGMFKRNQAVNYPVQGSAFHCLLWALIQVNKALRRYHMRSKVVGQIHDSLVGDVRENELKDYLEIVEYVVTVLLRKHWKWIIVPLEVEYEISPRNSNWFEKKEVKFKQGKFFHPSKPGVFTTDAGKFLNALTSNPNGKAPT